jgi:hypothetical protein
MEELKDALQRESHIWRTKYYKDKIQKLYTINYNIIMNDLYLSFWLSRIELDPPL